MKNLLTFFLLLPAVLFAQDYHQLVNPFIGTGGHGHTFPGATAPFGFCQLSPDTRIDGSWDGCGGYHYSDSIIYGFSHTHLSGTGVSDYGDILLMPVTKEMALDNYQYKSTFSHQNEKAVAGYYQVFLNQPKVNVELTTSRRCGFHKYTFPQNTEQYVVLDLAHRDEVLDSRMEQVDAHTIRGYRFSKAWATNQKVFYEIKFEKEIEKILYEHPKSGSRTMMVDLEKSQRALIKLKVQSGELEVRKLPKGATAEYKEVLVKVGISGVDENGASNNLDQEIPVWGFEKTKKWVQEEWNKELSKLKVADNRGELAAMMHPELYGDSLLNYYQGIKSDKQTVFYSALYHCMIAPNIYSDVDNRYRGRDDKIHNTQGKFDYYTVFSLWDTYRALHPLLTIIDKKRTNDFINTFIKQYEQGGRLPVWELSSNETNCMIGYHAVSVIWDAYNKGIRDYDAEKAFEAMKSIATEDMPGIQSYMKYGYVRAEDDHESVSKTLEYAYDDWCIAQMAKALGKEEDYKIFEKRSHNWINVYDPTTGFMRARKNSTLIEPFSPYLVDNNYTEANSWQYSFYVPHDFYEFRKILGGKDSLESKLDALFIAKTATEGREQSDITGLIGQYAHGNEPSHHIAYLYHLNGQSEKGEKIIKEIMNDFYLNSPNGYIGNEDCGQMSAWYVLNALGMYSVCPGDVNFILSGIYGYIESKSDYFDYTNSGLWIYQDMDSKGKNIVSIDTVFKWSSADEISYKELEKDEFIPAPFIVRGERTFLDRLEIEFGSLDAGKILYSIGDSKMLNRQDIGKKILELKESQTINFALVPGDITPQKNPKTGKLQVNVNKSPIQIATFTKLPNDRQVYLNCTYGKTYHAGGPMGLVDGIKGTTNWRAGEWQGYQGQDFEAVIAFDKVKEINNVSANFLQDQRAWIFFPTEVEFYTSKDSINWQLIEKKNIDFFRDEENTTIKQKTASTNKQIKYIKVTAKNFGNLPAWHPGAGNPAYIFIDEIEIK